MGANLALKVVQNALIIILNYVLYVNLGLLLIILESSAIIFFIFINNYLLKIAVKMVLNAVMAIILRNKQMEHLNVRLVQLINVEFVILPNLINALVY